MINFLLSMLISFLIFGCHNDEQKEGDKDPNISQQTNWNLVWSDEFDQQEFSHFQLVRNYLILCFDWLKCFEEHLL